MELAIVVGISRENCLPRRRVRLVFTAWVCIVTGIGTNEQRYCSELGCVLVTAALYLLKPRSALKRRLTLSPSMEKVEEQDPNEAERPIPTENRRDQVSPLKC